ncbi:MAG: bZIP transcription factor, partial [Acidimicrobiaceae bacterium]|nr:bZIP transcription factor [Acidimicrobiaceae bacterium]
MTTSAPIPAAGAASPMVNPSDTAPETATEQAQARAGAATVVRPSLRAQVAENPLLSFFGLVIIALLTAAIVSPHIRIDDINIRIDDTNERIDRLEAKVDRLEAKVDRLEAKVDRL